MSNDQISIEYVPINEIERWPRNPKEHDLEQIKASLRRHGYIDPIVRDATTGRIVAGHGRQEALTLMHKAGEDAPKRVSVLDDGRWAVPVLVGVSFENENEAEAYLVASNRLVEIGGWDDKMLSEMLGDMREAEASMDGVGFTAMEITSLLTVTDEEKAVGKSPEDKLEGFLTGEVKQLVFYFEDEEYSEVLTEVEKVMLAEKLETNTDAFLYILEEFKKSRSN